MKDRRLCVLCERNLTPNYKNTKLLSQFVSMYTGKIYGRHITRLCRKRQEQVENEISKAQNAGWLAIKRCLTVEPTSGFEYELRFQLVVGRYQNPLVLVCHDDRFSLVVSLVPSKVSGPRSQYRFFIQVPLVPESFGTGNTLSVPALGTSTVKLVLVPSLVFGTDISVWHQYSVPIPRLGAVSKIVYRYQAFTKEISC